mgnify:CR=1 FL=1
MNAHSIKGPQAEGGEIKQPAKKGNLLQRLRSMLPLVEPLVLGSIIDVDERAIALEARGFSSDRPKTFFRIVGDHRW